MNRQRTAFRRVLLASPLFLLACAPAAFGQTSGGSTGSASKGGLRSGAHPSGSHGEVRIDCGASSGSTASTGDWWAKDRGFTLPSNFFSHTSPITGTPDPALYQRGRHGPSFSYALPVPNGVYDVTLHFAEHEVGARALRTFSVRCEGTTWLDSFDVFAEAGAHAACQRTLRTGIEDGRLDLDFVASNGPAFVNAIEVHSTKILTSSLSSISFGTVALGASQTQSVVLANGGLHSVRITEIAFLNQVGAGHDFTVALAGQTFAGDHGDVSHVTAIDVAPGASINAQVTFAPTHHVPNEVELRFSGDFETPVAIELAGTGGTGDPFLHATILVAPVTIDLEQDGSEVVVLDGSSSHTHELGHTIASWTWRSQGAVIGSGPMLEIPFGVGAHGVELTIADDNVPPRTLTDEASFEVVDASAVPGVLGLWYRAVGDPSLLLTNVPAHADQAQVLPSLSVSADQTIGGPITLESGMVRLLARLEVPAAGSYAFVLQGGAGHALHVDGLPVSEPVALGPGTHALDVRFTIDAPAGGLPLAVLVSQDGGAAGPVDPSRLTHDEASALPVINQMPVDGLEEGGYPLAIEGFGFFPRADTRVHWGTTVFESASLRSWEPGRVEIVVPPGTGSVQVRVENAVGLGDTHVFTYSPDGSVPIVFEPRPILYVEKPTTAEFGPDGRLYVGTLGGEIVAIAFDEDYQATSITTYAGVSALANHNVLGLAFSPFEPDDGATPLKLYVAHTELFAQGGSTFTGPSPYPGQVSVLSSPTFDSPQPLITRLPTGNHDHGINGMTFDDNGDLLFAVGGNTNAGVAHPNVGALPESPLSGAILKARLSLPGFTGDLSYRRTADGAIDNDQVQGEIVDLFGGAGDVVVHASGIRNAYDLVLTTKNLLYATDNGPNLTYGPASTGMTTETATHPETADELLLVEKDQYYGHPNRNRGRYDARQAVYHAPGDPAVPDVYVPPLVELPASSNGIVEYRANAFQGALRGQLLVQRWNDRLYRVRLAGDGRDVLDVELLQPLLAALDVVTGPGGAILGLDYTNNRVVPLVPSDFGAGSRAVYDVTPWRARASGGARFTIGGFGFGTLAETTVTFGGIPATLTSVTPRRIQGIVPANPNAAGTLQTVVVTSSATGQIGTLTEAFRPLPVPGQSLGSWTPGPAMPESLGEVAGGVIGGKLYLVGEGSDRTLAYDITTLAWTNTLAPRPFPGHHHAAEVHAGKLYLFGGLGAGSPGKVQVYDPATNAWSVGADMPWPAGSASSARIGGTVYVAGGIVGSTTVDTCAAYDLATNTWTPRASMPAGQGRNHAASGTDGVRFYVFGGRGVGSGDGNWVANGFDTTLVYDPVLDAWQSSLTPGSTLAPLPQKRGGTGKAAFYQGEFHVIGGETIDGGGGANAQGVYARVDVYDPQTNTWRPDRPMPTARHGIFPAVYQGRLFVAGGGVASGPSSSNVLEIFTRQ